MPNEKDSSWRMTGIVTEFLRIFRVMRGIWILSNWWGCFTYLPLLFGLRFGRFFHVLFRLQTKIFGLDFKVCLLFVDEGIQGGERIARSTKKKLEQPNREAQSMRQKIDNTALHKKRRKKDSEGESSGIMLVHWCLSMHRCWYFDILIWWYLESHI